MKVFAAWVAALGLVALGSIAVAQPASQGQSPWRTCCGANPWPQGGMMGGSMARHPVAMMGGGPAPYTHVANPLPHTAATIEHGAAIYAANCASCHGATGLGDGAVAAGLNPRPANLAWLSNMPMSRWDPFMYWTIAEGGSQFGSAMPAFKTILAKDDIWAVTAYIQAHLPPAKTGH